jgi:hypothetical protein
MSPYQLKVFIIDITLTDQNMFVLFLDEANDLAKLYGAKSQRQRCMDAL